MLLLYIIIAGKLYNNIIGNYDNYRSYASGLPAQITASLTIGLTGMPFSGSDIG
jgi:alpha-glucosidase (family GH31 glycosyl hydrolase)